MDRIDIERRVALLFGAAALLGACGDSGTSTPPNFVPNPSPPPPGGGAPFAETFTSGLVRPWGMAFLPDARILVTERDGNMRLVSADGQTVSAPLTGLPAVYVSGQGGLLDVAIDPEFTTTPWVYWTYAEGDNNLSGTAVARGKLHVAGNALTDVQVIFRQSPKVAGDGHYGSRLVFANDVNKTLFVMLGEREQDDPALPTKANAQNPGKHLGKVVRINRDGTVPADNPFVGVDGYLQEIYSLGHRNPQGAALHPTTGELWLNEHGPQGGDEVNRVLRGKNYGWPLVSYGCPYNSPPGPGCQVNGGIHTPDFEEPVSYWVPTSIAPSGMMFYTGTRFTDLGWQGSVFIGALAGQALWRVALSGNSETGREALFTDLNERIRDVRQGPDGWIYLLTDNADGRIVRIRR
jgi:glucose/arabinose dehydrogenase